ncbi:MAG: hypothetical protein L3J39_09655 [Verrucomicrobiales bacterium]|nr:hypothetical protein [Verrucomicrobiales bacterium]
MSEMVKASDQVNSVLSDGRVAWVVALMPEAKAVIRHFSLKKIKTASLFPIYQSGDQRVSLVVSGMGKIQSAAAVISLFHELDEAKGVAWINFGIAGHRDRELGELRWVNKLQDAGSEQKWYPPRLYRTGKRLASALLTVDQPGDYPAGDTLVDMEASGFYTMASRLSTRELVQCVKLVSDNAQQSWRDLDKGQVGRWVEQHMVSLVDFSDEMMSLSAQERSRCAPPAGLAEVLQEWRFSETERHQLHKILRRWQAMSVEDTAVAICVRNGVKSSAEALKVLQQELIFCGDEAIVARR